MSLKLWTQPRGSDLWSAEPSLDPDAVQPQVYCSSVTPFFRVAHHLLWVWRDPAYSAVNVAEQDRRVDRWAAGVGGTLPGTEWSGSDSWAETHWWGSASRGRGLTRGGPHPGAGAPAWEWTWWMWGTEGRPVWRWRSQGLGRGCRARLCRMFQICFGFYFMYVFSCRYWTFKNVCRKYTNMVKFQKIGWKVRHFIGTTTKVVRFWAVDGNDSSVLVSSLHLSLTMYIVENVLICTKYRIKYLEVKRQYTGNLFINRSGKKLKFILSLKLFWSFQEIHIYMSYIIYVWNDLICRIP